jgi:transcriptional regulator with XRE-family HTH domain
MARRRSPFQVALFENGQRQRVIAKQAGLDETTLSNIKTGHRPPTKAQAAALARVLGVSVRVLFPDQGA